MFNSQVIGNLGKLYANLKRIYCAATNRQVIIWSYEWAIIIIQTIWTKATEMKISIIGILPPRSYKRLITCVSEINVASFNYFHLHVKKLLFAQACNPAPFVNFFLNLEKIDFRLYKKISLPLLIGNKKKVLCLYQHLAIYYKVIDNI